MNERKRRECKKEERPECGEVTGQGFFVGKEAGFCEKSGEERPKTDEEKESEPGRDKDSSRLKREGVLEDRQGRRPMIELYEISKC
jgi:hypothetical protein